MRFIVNMSVLKEHQTDILLKTFDTATQKGANYRFLTENQLV